MAQMAGMKKTMCRMLSNYSSHSPSPDDIHDPMSMYNSTRSAIKDVSRLDVVLAGANMATTEVKGDVLNVAGRAAAALIDECKVPWSEVCVRSVRSIVLNTHITISILSRNANSTVYGTYSLTDRVHNTLSMLARNSDDTMISAGSGYKSGTIISTRQYKEAACQKKENNKGKENRKKGKKKKPGEIKRKIK
jgi:hypothetical protein